MVICAVPVQQGGECNNIGFAIWFCHCFSFSVSPCFFLRRTLYFVIFLFFSALNPVCFSSSFLFVRAADICSPLLQVRVLLVSFVFFCHLRIPFVLFCFTFRGSCFLGWRVCCALVPGTLAFDLPRTLTNSRLCFVFLYLTVCDHIICISLGWRIRTDTGCTADVG